MRASTHHISTFVSSTTVRVRILYILRIVFERRPTPRGFSFYRKLKKNIRSKNDSPLLPIFAPPPCDWCFPNDDPLLINDRPRPEIPPRLFVILSTTKLEFMPNRNRISRTKRVGIGVGRARYRFSRSTAVYAEINKGLFAWSVVTKTDDDADFIREYHIMIKPFSPRKISQTEE